METTGNRNAATIVHLSTFSQWFFPFGNFILPIIIWSSFKNKSAFIERHGRNVINFELSLLLYGIIAAVIAIPILIYSIASKVSVDKTFHGDFVFNSDWTWADIAGWPSLVIVIAAMYGLMKVAEFFLVILAAVKAANGQDYQYPLTINFIKEHQQEPTISEPVSSTE